MHKKILTTLFLLFISFPTLAANMLPSGKVISGLDQALTDEEIRNTIPVIFPAEVPTTTKKYFASADIIANKNGFAYWINVDATKNCKGAQACNIGSMSAEIGGSPVIEYDMQNQEITVPVTLNNKLKGYFTPGHPMGSFFPAQIQWRDKNVLYTLVWTDIPAGTSEKDILLAMANSTIAKKR